MGAVHGEGVLAFGTQLHSRINSTTVCGWATTGTAAAVFKKKFNLSVSISAGPVSKNHLHQECFRFHF